MHLQLFSTVGCHLCEQAQELVRECSIVTLEILDIFDHPDWQTRYGVRIPVLVEPKTQAELAWPFTLSELTTFIERMS
ncbi:glutaredoxin family protein [Methylocucumis oryzae]|uniref:Glutaredoxin n=1 Tax=Methylocucumis oryzae TaxID=1632867 RepID=A0A0F3IHV9_9GAMM|nr:glutaredoxin family protein [Methylocucumis oryzae]KJV06257.1 hypothetical protein VZ94_12455 [Methylocucumis oryzae]